MKSKKLIIFTLVTFAVILAATMMTRHRAPTSAVEKQLLFPQLADNVNNVATIGLTKQEKSLTLSLQDNQWVIQEADNYPANFGKVRETVIAIAEMMVLAEKTSNAELYKKLGVEEPSATNSDSLHLSLLDASGNSLAAFIVGNPRHSKSAEDRPGLYVRLANAQAALLVEGRLDVSADVRDWFQRSLFSIDANRIKHIHIAHADGSTVTLSRDAGIDDFTLQDLPAGKQMQSNVIISRMGTMLEDVSVDNVMKADKLAGVEQTTATIHTFNGLLITIVSAVVGKDNYATFSFAADDNVSAAAAEQSEKEETTTASDKPGPAQEAESLNKLMSGWAYAIPSFKFELFTRKLEQLSKDAGTTDKSPTES